MSAHRLDSPQAASQQHSRTRLCEASEAVILFCGCLQLFGFVWGGPSSHFWFGYLERTFGGRKDAATIAQKVPPEVPPCPLTASLPQACAPKQV